MKVEEVTRWRLLGVLSLGVLILLVLNRVSFHNEPAVNQNFPKPAATILTSLNRQVKGDPESPPGNVVVHSSAGKEQALKRSHGGIAHYTEHFYEKLRILVERKADSRDPELIQLIKEVMDAPSKNPHTKLSYPVMKTPQVAEVIKVLNTTRKGFFVECGALDGERSSNTIELETDRGWTGLLVEMDPHFYTQILGKARKSWSINACLSPYPYVIELQFHASKGGHGKLHVNKEAAGKPVNSAPCFPLESILLAINQSHVHYFSLDVEGVELDIIKTIPFERLTIDIFSVEYRHGGKTSEMLKYMNVNKYRMHRNIIYSNPAISLYVKDFIFVRNDLSQ